MREGGSGQFRGSGGHAGNLGNVRRIEEIVTREPAPELLVRPDNLQGGGGRKGQEWTGPYSGEDAERKRTHYVQSRSENCIDGRPPPEDGPRLQARRAEVVWDGGAIVRSNVALNSDQIGVVPVQSLLHVVEVRGRRAEISHPLKGWISIFTKNGNPIIKLENSQGPTYRKKKIGEEQRLVTDQPIEASPRAVGSPSLRESIKSNANMSKDEGKRNISERVWDVDRQPLDEDRTGSSSKSQTAAYSELLSDLIFSLQEKTSHLLGTPSFGTPKDLENPIRDAEGGDGSVVGEQSDENQNGWDDGPKLAEILESLGEEGMLADSSDEDMSDPDAPGEPQPLSTDPDSSSLGINANSPKAARHSPNSISVAGPTPKNSTDRKKRRLSCQPPLQKGSLNSTPPHRINSVGTINDLRVVKTPAKTERGRAILSSGFVTSAIRFQKDTNKWSPRRVWDALPPQAQAWKEGKPPKLLENYYAAPRAQDRVEGGVYHHGRPCDRWNLSNNYGFPVPEGLSRSLYEASTRVATPSPHLWHAVTEEWLKQSYNPHDPDFKKKIKYNKSTPPPPSTTAPDFPPPPNSSLPLPPPTNYHKDGAEKRSANDIENVESLQDSDPTVEKTSNQEHNHNSQRTNNDKNGSGTPVGFKSTQLRNRKRDRRTSSRDSLVAGITEIGKGIAEGAVGLFQEPIYGAREGGLQGFINGLGSGLVGFVSRPSQGLVNFVGSMDRVGRRMTPAQAHKSLSRLTLKGRFPDKLREELWFAASAAAQLRALSKPNYFEEKLREFVRIVESFKETLIEKKGKGLNTDFKRSDQKSSAEVSSHKHSTSKFTDQEIERVGRVYLEICKDLGRTFPSHPLFEDTDDSTENSVECTTSSTEASDHKKLKGTGDGKDEKWYTGGNVENSVGTAFAGTLQLKAVLSAFSRHRPDIGYCQCLNYVAAVLLLICEPETAFWILCALVDWVLPECYFNETLMGVVTDTKVLQMLVSKKLPRISKHLQKLDCNLSAASLQWFVCMFVGVLPIHLTIRVWDLVIVHGSHVLFWVALAVLHLNRARILEAKNEGELFNLITVIGSELQDEKTVMKAISSFRIPKNSIAQMRQAIFQRLQDSKLTKKR